MECCRSLLSFNAVVFDGSFSLYCKESLLFFVLALCQKIIQKDKKTIKKLTFFPSIGHDHHYLGKK